MRDDGAILVWTWNGTPICDMDKEDLVEALTESLELVKAYRASDRERHDNLTGAMTWMIHCHASPSQAIRQHSQKGRVE